MRTWPPVRLAVATSVAPVACGAPRDPMEWGSSRGAADPGGWTNQLSGDQHAFLASTGHLHEIGDLVVVHSLSAEHGLNGKRGHIRQRMGSTGRLSVCMEAGLGLKAIKPSNLWPVLDGDEDNDDEWMQDDGLFDEPGFGDDVGVDLDVGTRSDFLLHPPGKFRGAPQAAVAVPAWHGPALSGATKRGTAHTGGDSGVDPRGGRDPKRVAVASCGEDHQGPLLLDAVTGSHAPRLRWGDGYDDVTGRSADSYIGAAEQTVNLPDVPVVVSQAPKPSGSLWGGPSGGTTDWLHLDVGDPVVLHGLVGTPSLNGLHGTIERRVVDTARLAVRLVGGVLKSVNAAGHCGCCY